MGNLLEIKNLVSCKKINYENVVLKIISVGYVMEINQR